MNWNNQLRFGLLKNKDAEASLWETKLRSFTISWLRYNYYEEIIEGESVEEILDQAAQLGTSYCFILSPGILIREQWIPEFWLKANLENYLPKWLAENDFFVAGFVESVRNVAYLQKDAIIVNLAYYQKNTPVLSNLNNKITVAQIEQQGFPVSSFDAIFSACLLNVNSKNQSENQAFLELFDNNIIKYSTDKNLLSQDQQSFLKTIDLHWKNGRKGVFLWNLEPYTDVEEQPENFAKPITSLYSVGAGFKPNRILETHGFNERTKVCFYDYSPNALAIKKTMLEEWDGEDFPRFIEYLFKKFPYPETYYHLWDDLTPAEIDWKDMHTYWENELERWGGAQKFKNHWDQYKTLKHSFVHASILSDHDKITAAITNEKNAVIWWSNAFFTIYSNWLYTPEERKNIFQNWMVKLSQKNPNIFLYGSDYQNISINHLTAGEYIKNWFENEHSTLKPLSLNRLAIRH